MPAPKPSKPVVVGLALWLGLWLWVFSAPQPPEAAFQAVLPDVAPTASPVASTAPSTGFGRRGLAKALAPAADVVPSPSPPAFAPGLPNEVDVVDTSSLTSFVRSGGRLPIVVMTYNRPLLLVRGGGSVSGLQPSSPTCGHCALSHTPPSLRTLSPLVPLILLHMLFMA
jgi:hypothetical protein